MNDRKQQPQIRERAGLEESRINQEFVDFLRSPWFTGLCVILCVIAVAYAVRGHLKKREDAQVAQAFSELNAATSTENPSPASLERVAEEFGDVRGVGILATLAAADAHLNVVRVGVKPSAILTPDGALQNPDDVLTPEERASHLSQAEAQYQTVLTRTETMGGRQLQAINALYGLAAVAESRRDLEAAAKYYTQIEERTKDGPYAAHATIARQRREMLPSIATPAATILVSKAEIPWVFPPAPPQIQVPPSPPAPGGPVGPAVPEDAAPATAPATTPVTGAGAEAGAETGASAPASGTPDGSAPAPTEPAPTDPTPAQPPAAPAPK